MAKIETPMANLNDPVVQMSPIKCRQCSERSGPIFSVASVELGLDDADRVAR